MTFERNGEDLYPRIRQVVEEGRVPAWNRVRYEMFTRLGYFVTESSEHFAEYVPWFIKRDRPDLIERFGLTIPHQGRARHHAMITNSPTRANYRKKGAALGVPWMWLLGGPPGN